MISDRLSLSAMGGYVGATSFRVKTTGLVLCCVSVATIGFGQVVDEFPVPTSGSSPVRITAGPDGNLWFTEELGNKIGRITPGGVITEFAVPTVDSHPFGVGAGPDGNVWFTELFGSNVARITPSGAITEFPVTFNSAPIAIAAGSDGNLWFVEAGANSVGRITTSGGVTEFPIAIAGCNPQDITGGPNGGVWVIESDQSVGTNLNYIVEVTPSGTMTSFAIPLAHNQFATGIAAGPAGDLWFTEAGTNIVGRMTTTGVFSRYSTGAFTTPWMIAARPDGNMWFTEVNGGNIGRVTPAGVVSAFPVPTLNSEPTGIASGPDGNIWFTEYNGNQIGRILPGALAAVPTLSLLMLVLLAVGLALGAIYVIGLR